MTIHNKIDNTIMNANKYLQNTGELGYMTDSMGQGKLVRHMQHLSYTYDTYLICMGLGPSISSVIDKSLLIGSWEGEKSFRVGIFLNKNLLG